MSRRAGHAGRRSTTSMPPAACVPVIANIRPERRHLPDGGFLLRRRPAGADGAHRGPPAADAMTVTGQHARREHRRRRGLQRRRHPPARQPDLRRGRARGAARQPRARRLRDQAERLRAAPAEAHRPGARLRRLPGDEEGHRRPDDLDVTADHILVLRNAGPQGGPGMPEWGMLPIPTKLVKQGVRDMLRLSDARMSGTSYGACMLHCSPESYIGGPLALVADRRPHQRRRAGARASTSMCRTRAGAPPRRLDSRPRRATSAATAGCSAATSGRPTRAATSTSSKPSSARRSASRTSSERARPRWPD